MSDSNIPQAIGTLPPKHGVLGGVHTIKMHVSDV